jgi:PilZ domain
MSLAHSSVNSQPPGPPHDREYIRHPIHMPIEVKCSSTVAQLNLQLSNVSVGGLSFRSPRSFHRGSIVEIKISVRPVFRVHAVVQWCKAVGESFELGVEFLDQDDAYRVRMIEQICHINQYRDEVHQRSGKRISRNQASKEWIEKYAETFPR